MLACTIIARNYLPHARVLGASFAHQHPRDSFVALVIDGEPDDAPEPIETLGLDAIDIDQRDLREMLAIYDVMEMATAVKPWLLESLLRRDDVVVYLDPDIYVYGALEGVEAAARESGIVLTPHTLGPVPRDGLRPSEAELLSAGTFNLGFIAVTAAAVPMLRWWRERLRRDCIVDPERMLFTDQRWIDLVPGRFDVKVEGHPGMNVAYWNAHERLIEIRDGEFEVAGKPLVFFHFSGYEPERPRRLSKHQGDAPRVVLPRRADLLRLTRQYGEALAAASFGPPVPYRWDVTPNGLRLDRWARRAYRSALLEFELGQEASRPPNPLDPITASSFESFMAGAGSAKLSPYLRAFYEATSHLQSRFPDPDGRDLPELRYWAATEGVRSFGLNSRLVGPRPLGPRLRRSVRHRARRLLGWRPSRPRAHPTGGTVVGANVAGYFTAELGVGESARLLLSALDAAAVPTRTVTFTDTANRLAWRFSPRGATAPPFDVNLVAVNPDRLPRFASQVGAEWFRGRYTIGYWHWEVDVLPAEYQAGLAYVDEVWCGSRFTQQAVGATTDKPVLVCPPPILAEPPRTTSRSDLALPSERFIFLFAFDFFSVFERKNPDALVRAYRQAFDPADGAYLLIKSVNGEHRSEQLMRLRAEAAGREDISVRDEYVDADARLGLISEADCYVSLHRAEGFGLTLAEAMAVGTPAIATAYSGNLEFMTQANSWLVPYELVPVGDGSDPYPRTAHWAEPDIASAATIMRHVFEHPDEAVAKAAVASAQIAALHSADARADFVRARVEAALSRLGSAQFHGVGERIDLTLRRAATS